MRYILLFLKGAAIGAANIIPGVSGGTIAVTLRVFDELIASVNELFKNFKKSLKFLLPVGIGMAAGILLLGSLIDYCLRTFSFQTTMFFVGLVAGSVPLIYRKAVSKAHKKSHWFAAAAAAAVVIALALIGEPDQSVTEAVITPGYQALLFAGGAAAAMAMVVPGISGSFIMMLIGLYPTVLGAVTSIKDYLFSPLNFSLLPPILAVMAPLGLGIIIGIAVITKLIAFLLEKFFSVTYFAILGLLLGTIFAMFNNPVTYQSHAGGLTAPVVITAALTFALGAALALLLGKE